MIPDGPTFVQPRQELQQKQTRRDSLNIWRDGGMEGWHNLSYQLEPREGPRKAEWLEKKCHYCRRDWSFYLCKLQPAGLNLGNLIPSTVLWLQLSQQIQNIAGSKQEIYKVTETKSQIFIIITPAGWPGPVSQRWMTNPTCLNNSM